MPSQDKPSQWGKQMNKTRDRSSVAVVILNKHLSIVVSFSIAILTAYPLLAGELTLKAGMNLISFTQEPDPTLTSRSLDTLLGPELLAVSRVDVVQQILETTTFQGGAQGADFSIRINEAYIVNMATDKVVELTGIEANVTLDLGPGVNLVGFNPVLPYYRAFDLLKRIGQPDTVTSLRHFDRDTGRYQTALQTAGGTAGENFRILPGEGYLVFMLQNVNGLTVPYFFFVRASENFLILREVMSGGGGKSENTNFRLYSVIGQPTPLGPATSASYRISGGFLSNPLP